MSDLALHALSNDDSEVAVVHDGVVTRYRSNGTVRTSAITHEQGVEWSATPQVNPVDVAHAMAQEWQAERTGSGGIE